MRLLLDVMGIDGHGISIENRRLEDSDMLRLENKCGIDHDSNESFCECARAQFSAASAAGISTFDINGLGAGGGKRVAGIQEIQSTYRIGADTDCNPPPP